jgi:hypothetical protein
MGATKGAYQGKIEAESGHLIKVIAADSNNTGHKCAEHPIRPPPFPR